MYCNLALFGWVTVIKLCQCCWVPSQVASSLHGKNHGRRRLFTPIPQNVFEQKEWNLQLIEARILSSCLLLPLLYSVYSEARLGWRKSHFLLSFFSCLLTLSSTVFCPFFTDERKCTITLILHFLDTQY